MGPKHFSVEILICTLISENQGPFQNLKIDITKVPLLFRISYSLLLEIAICMKYFSDKNSQNQTLMINFKTKMDSFRLFLRNLLLYRPEFRHHQDCNHLTGEQG